MDVDEEILGAGGHLHCPRSQRGRALGISNLCRLVPRRVR